MLNIALFGPPGAGKGTQSKLLLEKYKLTYISTGDILRKEIADGSILGLKAKAIIEKGGLADDEIIVQIIENVITRDVDSVGILFDGFPRTIVQAYILDGLLLRLGSSLSAMLSLEVPRDELIHRMMERAKTSGRKDDNLEVIKFRMQEYENKTKPVADFYKAKGLYYPIDGLGSIEDIFNKLTKTITRTLKRKWINVVLYGPPGAGKGTQAQMIADKYNLVYISTGKLLRAEMQNGTEIGNAVKEQMRKGEIVPDEIAISLIENKIKMHPDANGFIFKGFPRTIVQAYILDGLLLKLNQSVTTVIGFDTSTLECFKRLSARGKTNSRRPYDEMELIINRLDEFYSRTQYVADYYKKHKKFTLVDANGSEDEIFARLGEKIEETMTGGR
jgi:adenylate kinase